MHNTVMFGMMHVKYHPLVCRTLFSKVRSPDGPNLQPYLFYERRIVTWNTTAPYEYISVSKPLTYSGTNQADPIFTVSMACTRSFGLLRDCLLIVTCDRGSPDEATWIGTESWILGRRCRDEFRSGASVCSSVVSQH